MVHQRQQWHPRGGQGCCAGLRGLQRGFPSISSPRCSGSFLGLITALCLRMPACSRGQGGWGCPGHKSPLKGCSGVVAGTMLLSSQGPAAACFTRIWRQRAVLPRAPLQRGVTSPVTAERRNQPSIPLQPWLRGAKLLGLAGQRLDHRVAIGPCSNLACPCESSRLSGCPRLVPPCYGHPLGVKKVWERKHPAAEKPRESGYTAPVQSEEPHGDAQGRPVSPKIQHGVIPCSPRGKQANATCSPLGWYRSHSPMQQHPRHTSSRLTLRYHLAEDGQGVQRGAVPAAVAELVLALLDGQLGPAPHRVHHLQVPLAHLHLTLDQALQLLAGLLLGDAPH